jgi:hypothetical protein
LETASKALVYGCVNAIVLIPGNIVAIVLNCATLLREPDVCTVMVGFCHILFRDPFFE